MTAMPESMRPDVPAAIAATAASSSSGTPKPVATLLKLPRARMPSVASPAAQRRGHRPHGAVAAGDHDVVAVTSRPGCQLRRVVVLRQDVEPHVEALLAQRVGEGGGLQLIRVVREVRPGAGLAAGDRVDEEQDRSPLAHAPIDGGAPRFAVAR